MHLLRTQPGGFVSDDNIADLGQTPAELVILCSGDSSLALLAEAAQQLPEDYPSFRLANPMQVQNHASVDLYVDEVLRQFGNVGGAFAQGRDADDDDAETFLDESDDIGEIEDGMSVQDIDEVEEIKEEA